MDIMIKEGKNSCNLISLSLVNFISYCSTIFNDSMKNANFLCYFFKLIFFCSFQLIDRKDEMNEMLQ